MKKFVLVIIGIVFIIISCSNKKNELLGGLENLKWHSDLTEMKSYMENVKHASYKNYEIDRTDKVFIMRFSGSEYAGVGAENWELYAKEGKFIGFRVEFKNDKGLFDRLKKSFETKLGNPEIEEKGKVVWNKTGDEKNFSEKFTLREFENEIILSTEIKGK